MQDEGQKENYCYNFINIVTITSYTFNILLKV